MKRTSQSAAFCTFGGGAARGVAETGLKALPAITPWRSAASQSMSFHCERTMS